MEEFRVAYIKENKSIGVIIDEGCDVSKWYRTDSDGVRESHELIFLRDKPTIDYFIKDGANIAPSTKITINNYYKTKNNGKD